MREPKIHSHIEDELPEDHPLAYESVWCDGDCGRLVHAGNNECMRTWVETGRGNLCLWCFCQQAEKVTYPGSDDVGYVLFDEFGLPDEGRG